MSHVPTVLKSDRSVFDKMLPVDDNGFSRSDKIIHMIFLFIGGMALSCVISFNSEENWLIILSYLIMLYIVSLL